MAEDRDGSSGAQEGSARPKRKPIRPEDVRVILHRDGKGSEGIVPGPRQTAYLRKQRQKPKT